MIKKCILDNISLLRGNEWNSEYNILKLINTKEKLMNFQKDCLENILIHSYNNVPYYNKILSELGIINNGNVDLSKFNNIPLLSKYLLNKNYENLISSDLVTRKWHHNFSGGSTGEPVRLIQDKEYIKWRNATNYYYFNDVLGIDEVSVRKIILWGSDRDLFKGNLGIKRNIINWFTNTVFLNSFKMTDEDLKSYIKTINSYRPDLIRGYAGSLYELCRYAERNKLKLYSPKMVISAAETLRPEMRQQIEFTFKTKLYDFYGSREVSNLAGECGQGMMHIFTFWNYVEILNKDNLPVSEGEEGKIVVTNLHNYAMPLIRYEIGDMAILGNNECGCGNILPTLKKITGRITDHFLLADGTTVPAEFFIHLIGVVCNEGYINKFQVVQEDYNYIRILAVMEKEMNSSQKQDIENKIKYVMGNYCQIKWDFVDDIPKSTSGKYLYTKSFVWK